MSNEVSIPVVFTNKVTFINAGDSDIIILNTLNNNTMRLRIQVNARFYLPLFKALKKEQLTVLITIQEIPELHFNVDIDEIQVITKLNLDNQI